MRPVRCVQKQGADAVKVPESHCPPDSAPDAVEKCNLQLCPARYEVHTVLFIIYNFFLGLSAVLPLYKK